LAERQRGKRRGKCGRGGSRRRGEGVDADKSKLTPQQNAVSQWSSKYGPATNQVAEYVKLASTKVVTYLHAFAQVANAVRESGGAGMAWGATLGMEKDIMVRQLSRDGLGGNTRNGKGYNGEAAQQGWLGGQH